jgi:protein phosphatase 1 regulatory subunit 11
MSRTRPTPNPFQTTTETAQESLAARIPATLRLRAEEAPTDTREDTSSSRRIRWSEDVVDNEGMGRKSSKGMYLIYLFYLFELFRTLATI